MRSGPLKSEFGLGIGVRQIGEGVGNVQNYAALRDIPKVIPEMGFLLVSN